jgi:hypothetical protein
MGEHSQAKLGVALKNLSVTITGSVICIQKQLNLKEIERCLKR